MKNFFSDTNSRDKGGKNQARSGNRSGKSSASAGATDPNKSWRETIESIVVAVILAFLFRAFVAEAFVIPTGSMAPTLQGRHMDVTCVKCGYPYRTGASIENDGGDQVVATTCPICRYTMDLNKSADPNQQSFNGDRILVSKFAYEVGDPQRWDVIVFKYPGNAKQNYIKRLVGLPRETLRVLHGDLFYLKDADAERGETKFHIARKPPRKLQAMLQLVDDTNYVPQTLAEAGWPTRWQDWAHQDAPAWEKRSDATGFATRGTPDQEAWLRYRHVVPWDIDWVDMKDGRAPQRVVEHSLYGELILDYYAYNDGVESQRLYADAPGRRARRAPGMHLGMHWVGDLAIESEVEVQGDSGELMLDLVKGGVHYTCRIDVATGVARLAIDGGKRSFVGDEGGEVQQPQADTAVRGRGRYSLRFSNCDQELLLWVNDRVVQFAGPTTYEPEPDLKPRWSQQDAGDFEPLGIGARGVALAVPRLRVLRDVYYVAVTSETRNEHEYVDYYSEEDILRVMGTPELWATTPLFDARRRNVEFHLGPDQFFPLGDNSPQSRDARLWSRPDPATGQPHPPHFVSRELLTGEALLIYWPHAWRRPIPFWPNFKRMGLIR